MSDPHSSTLDKVGPAAGARAFALADLQVQLAVDKEPGMAIKHAVGISDVQSQRNAEPAAGNALYGQKKLAPRPGPPPIAQGSASPAQSRQPVASRTPSTSAGPIFSRVNAARACAPMTVNRRKSSTSSDNSVGLPTQAPYEPPLEYVQIHERFDAEATGANTLSGKIASTRNRKIQQILTHAQDRIKQDLTGDQKRCVKYVETEYRRTLDEDLPYLQKLKRRMLDCTWQGKRYEANLDLLEKYIKLTDKIYEGMRDNMSACMSGDAFQQSAFSMRLQAFRTKLGQVKALQATLEGIQRRSRAPVTAAPARGLAS